ncbi:glycoside hydrolase family 9 protein [Kitasatospora cheerisanensis]|uniref:Glycoside hydrolase family protein n=1 Tax=Kitasatospora cheerisanensis KCTC 2395 TaxID=1348663 RepID=A0A066YSS5_9ACTN|nr:glycoside hydrolase family 9 protein [Kitasatospora cheerisanensis]KDN80985.1 glycoside hydrolase family protein [Kitasatospora cheerisanensis KCTC 2395]
MVTPRTPARRTALGALLAAALTATPLALGAGPAQAAATGLVRVDQAGFLPGETKQAYLMTSAAVSAANWSLVDSAGATVKTGTVGTTSLGSWNSAYPAVYPITLTGLTTPGTYHLVVGGGVSATSPSFKVTDPAALYGRFVADGVSFFQTQRDGADTVPGPLGRKPAHLNDASANVYAVPSFQSGGSDVITNSDLSKTGGPVNVSGGWFDAGDYLKFTHTTAYADAVLLAAQRALGSAAPASLGAEAQFGAAWLNRMWDQSSKTLYLQVGIGSGNASGSFVGDHDLWRLPEKDDGDTSAAHRYAAAHRPVFRANTPGGQVSPNLAGRVSAAFALAAQVNAATDPAQAQAYYQAAASLYALANTSAPPNPLTTAAPNDYYPESTWRDDMEFGGAELALAAQKLGQNATPYLTAAAGWAKGYLANDKGDTFNLYDTSALAHADLIRAVAAAGNPGGLAVSTADLVADLKRQTKVGADHAAADLFHAGGTYTDFDVNSHSFGLLATEALYKQASGDTSFDAYATQQRNWLFGANPWGTGFMVGEGTTYPHCIQHQVANINGSTDGTGAIPLGAVVNGPNSSGIFSGGLGGYETGMKACPAGGADPFNAFTGHSSRYVDDVRSWQTSEPAIDMTGSAIIGAALQQAVNSAATPGSTGYEAEAAGNGLTGRAAVIACAACSGGSRVGYLGTVTAGTGTLTVNGITAATAGTYQVQLVYTNGSAGARTAELSVNGGPVTTLSFAPTGAFTTPGTVTVGLALAAGTNTVTLANPSGAAPDLDRLVVPASPA